MKSSSKPKPPSDESLEQVAARFVLAMMSSVDHDRINPRDWWDRAKSALETSAACAESFPQMVSRAGAKLQIASLSAKSGVDLAKIEVRVAGDWESFRSICERDALYLVALARLERDEKRNAARPEEVEC